MNPQRARLGSRAGYGLPLSCLLCLLVASNGFSQEVAEAADPPDAATLAERAAAAQREVQQHKVGRYAVELPGIPTQVVFETMRPYGVRPTPEQFKEQREGDGYTRDPMNPDGSSWQVHCPDNYTPDEAFGVLVFINAGDTGRLAPQAAALLADYKLIGVGADREGNRHNPVYRHAAAIHALQIVRERYHVDEDRVYVHGISGGGRMTSHVAIMNADLFDGAVCIVGCNPYKNIPADKGPNTMYRGFWRVPDRKLLQTAQEDNRLVLHTGEHDGNRHNTLQVYKAYERDGFRHLLYLEEPGLGHAFASEAYMRKALDFLDAPLYLGAEDAYTQAQDAESRGELGAARTLYSRAAKYGRDAAWIDNASAKADELNTRYAADLEALDTLFADADQGALDLTRAVNAFRRDWGRDDPAIPALRERVNERKQAERDP